MGCSFSDVLPGPGIPFFKLSPGGNTTVFVPLAAARPEDRAAVANLIMDPLHLGAEQVGFIDLNPEAPELIMMGGEFCGNACRSLAALLVMGRPVAGKKQAGALRSSGTDQPVLWRAEPLEKPGAAVDAAVRVDMQLASLETVKPGLVKVDMPGMCMLLFDEAVYPLPADPAAEAAQWREDLRLTEREGVGCVRHAPLRAVGGQHIVPLVWVRGTGSSCLETACGSASLALALAAHKLAGAAPRLDIRQPSGAFIRVELEEEQAGSLHGWIGGPVKLSAQGRLFL